MSSGTPVSYRIILAYNPSMQNPSQNPQLSDDLNVPYVAGSVRSLNNKLCISSKEEKKMAL